jgi:hypothetical protein
VSAETFGFFRELHSEGIGAGNYILIWTLTRTSPGTEQKESHWFQNIESAVAFVESCKAQNIYFQIGLSPRNFGPDARCKANEVSALPGLACDLDVLVKGVHEKAGLPPTLEDALRILPEQFPPTIVWTTGNGAQATWLFKELWELKSEEDRNRAAALSQRWHNFVATEAKRLGYVIDSAFSLEHLFRLPGTENRKRPDDPKPVTIIRNSGRRYDWTDLENILDTLGVPEVEVKSDDGRGHVEYGNLRVNPKVELDAATAALVENTKVNDNKFKRTWERSRRMKEDNSWSGFAMSLADTLAEVEATDQQIIDILCVHAREHGDAGKTRPRPLSWYTKYTIPRARKYAKEEQERQKRRDERDAKHLAEAEEASTVTMAQAEGTEQARKRLLQLLDLEVIRLVQVGNDLEPSYRIELKDGRTVEVPSLSAICSFQALDKFTWRSDEVLAHHEAAHGVCGHLLGRYMWELTIIEDRTVKVQKTSFSGGHAWSGDTPEPPSELPRRERAETDFRRAAEASRILSIIEPPFGWRSTLRIVRRMRAQANALVDANWRSIMALAEELLRQRELDQSQIARFLRPETRGSYWRNRSQEGGGT